MCVFFLSFLDDVVGTVFFDGTTVIFGKTMFFSFTSMLNLYSWVGLIRQYFVPLCPLKKSTSRFETCFIHILSSLPVVCGQGLWAGRTGQGDGCCFW